MGKIQLIVNGEKRELEEATTLSALLESLDLKAGRMACELNREIVKRAHYPDTVLKQGDSLEIVQMIGGG